MARYFTICHQNCIEDCGKDVHFIHSDFSHLSDIRFVVEGECQNCKFIDKKHVHMTRENFEIFSKRHFCLVPKKALITSDSH